MIVSARLVLLFLSLVLCLPIAARSEERGLILPKKFHFPGFVGFDRPNALISLNFRLTVLRNGSVRGHVVRFTTTFRGNASLLGGEEDICRLRGRLRGKIHFRHGIVASGIELRGSKGGAITGRLRLAAGSSGIFEALTATPELFGLEKEATTINALNFSNPVFVIDPTPTPFPTPIPFP